MRYIFFLYIDFGKKVVLTCSQRHTGPTLQYNAFNPVLNPVLNLFSPVLSSGAACRTVLQARKRCIRATAPREHTRPPPWRASIRATALARAHTRPRPGARAYAAPPPARIRGRPLRAYAAAPASIRGAALARGAALSGPRSEAALSGT